MKHLRVHGKREKIRFVPAHASALVAADLVTLDALQRTFLHISTVEEAEAAASARQVVTERANRDLATIVAGLKEQAEGLQQDPQAALASIGFTTDVDHILSLQGEGTFPVTGAADLVVGIVHHALSNAHDGVVHAQQLLEHLDAVVKDPNGRVDPTPATDSGLTPGPCTVEAASMATLQNLLGDDRLHRWERIVGAEDEQNLVQLESQLAQCSEHLSRVQVTLYNLWAIRQIYAAQDSGGGSTF